MQQNTQNPTILVADDDADDQAILAEAFQEAGVPCNLHFVNDGDEIVDALEKTRTALLLLDINMPRMNGLTALKALREDDAHRNLPVIVMTTSWSEHDIQRSYENGANSFIIKPVVYQELVETVRSLYGYWFSTCELPR